MAVETPAPFRRRTFCVLLALTQRTAARSVTPTMDLSFLTVDGSPFPFRSTAPRRQAGNTCDAIPLSTYSLRPRALQQQRRHCHGCCTHAPAVLPMDGPADRGTAFPATGGAPDSSSASPAADALFAAAPSARPRGNGCDGTDDAVADAADAAADGSAPAPAAVPPVPWTRRARTAATALAGSRRVRRVRDVLRAITALAEGCATCTRVALRTTRYTRGRPYA